MEKERNYWLGFSAFPGVGPTKFKALLVNFGSAKSSWFASKKDLERVLGVALSEKFEKFKGNFSAEGYARALEKKGVSFLILEDEEYPQLLKEIKNPPFVLYVKGAGRLSHVADESENDVRLTHAARDTRSAYQQNQPQLRSLSESRHQAKENLKGKSQSTFSSLAGGQAPIGAPLVAVVGTRKITNYGREVTEILVRELVAAGFTIVSGLAMGVDAVAHKTAIDCNGKTIAVLGSGVDFCTPPANQGLYNSIVSSGGAIVSEFPLSQPPTKGSFPSRNRIIAGLSQAVLVTEGAEDSGALITADYAFKNNRKVFAVPGPITSSLSKGPYKLISKGAKLVTSAEDIITELGGQAGRIKNYELRIKRGETEEENRILEILENEPIHFDTIARILKLDSSKAASILSIMEIKGMVKSSGTGFFSLVS